MGEKSTTNLLAAIEASKKRPLDRVIYALGIRYVGSGAANLLADYYGSIGKLQKSPASEIDGIEGIGPTIAESIVQFFQQKSNQKVLEKLKQSGVRMEEIRDRQKRGIFAGKTFVLTGALSRFTRDGATTLIESEGGKVSSSVSRNTDYMLVGSSPGSKYRKALDLGIRIIDEDTFVNIMEKAKKRSLPHIDQLGMEL
jgi:DNA ligase (NAD+)